MTTGLSHTLNTKDVSDVFSGYLIAEPYQLNQRGITFKIMRPIVPFVSIFLKLAHRCPATKPSLVCCGTDFLIMTSVSGFMVGRKTHFNGYAVESCLGDLSLIFGRDRYRAGCGQFVDPEIILEKPENPKKTQYRFLCHHNMTMSVQVKKSVWNACVK